MPIFPQLATGAMGQYPLRRMRRSRTVENTMPDGHAVRLADNGAERTEWRLEYQELTDGELDALIEFFQAVEGRLGTFTFLDPAGNLVAWSEQLDEPAWEKGPLVTVEGGVTGPAGEVNAWRVANGGAAPAGIAQTLNVPEELYYCLSVWVRSVQTTQVTLVRGGARTTKQVTAEWNRLTFAAQAAGTAESVLFGLELAPGAAVEVCGFQVEAQAGASGYKKTGARGGVYGNARLAGDELKITTVGQGRHGCTLNIIHGEHF